MPRYLVPFFGLCLLFNVSVPNAYSQNDAFQELSVGISLGQSLGGNELSSRWEAKPSLQLALRTSFYTGELETGFRYTRFSHSPEFPDYSDFDSFFFYLGWGYALAITDRLSAGPGLRFGTTFFQYDEAKIYTQPNVNWEYDFDTSESEFAYELLFRSVFKISRHFSAHAELAYNRTLTFQPIRLNYITAGFTYTIDSPDWLMKVIK